MKELDTAKHHIEELIRGIKVDIVLIDDNPNEMEIIRAVLEENGFKSVQCLAPDHTTVERLEMLNPKLIISDLFGCLGVDAMIKHFGSKVIINTGFNNQMVHDSVGKDVYRVAFKDDPKTLIDSINNFFMEAA